jgi:SnoaL-like domain
MKRLLTTAALVLGTFCGSMMQVQAASNDIVSFVPSTPIPPAGIKLQYFDRDQLFGGDAADIIAINQIWAAYVFYHDTHDGQRFASLFLPDAIWDQMFNNNGTLVPASGIDGNGCLMRGRAQISDMIGVAETHNAPALMIPGTSHHKVNSPLVKVDGDTAVMTAPWFSLGYDMKSAATRVHDGGTYFVKLKRTPDHGWMIQAVHIMLTAWKGKPGQGKQDICTLSGPTDMK